MNKEIEAFRNEVLRWRGTRRRGARPYTSAMRAKALELTAGLRNRGLTMEAATRQPRFLGSDVVRMEEDIGPHRPAGGQDCARHDGGAFGADQVDGAAGVAARIPGGDVGLGDGGGSAAGARVGP